MTTITIDRLSVAFGRMFKDFRVAQKKGLLSAAMKGQSWILTKLWATLDPPPFDNNTFRAGWNHKATDDGAILFNPVPHAVFINFGVPPDRVRVTGPMLLEWVQRKGIGGDNPLGIAWHVAKNLRRKGIFMDDQYRFTERVRNEFLIKEIPKEIASELRKIKWKS